MIPVFVKLAGTHTEQAVVRVLSRILYPPPHDSLQSCHGAHEQSGTCATTDSAKKIVISRKTAEIRAGSPVESAVETFRLTLGAI